MFQYGFHHVLAARGCEPTRWWRQRRDTIPVEIHRQQKHLSYNRLNRHSFALNLNLWQAPMLGARRCCLCCLLIQIPAPYTSQGLPHGFFYHRVGLLLLIYVVEGYLHMNTFVRQYMFVQAVCLAHQSSEMIALNGMLKQRLGCPNQYLCLVATGQIGYTQWPRYKSFTMTIQVVYCYLTTQFF